MRKSIWKILGKKSSDGLRGECHIEKATGMRQVFFPIKIKPKYTKI